MQLGFILSLFFAIIIAVFALQNGGKVTVDFLFADIEVSQAIIIFVSAALGAIIVSILGLIRQVKLSLKIKEQEKKISSLENERIIMENKINALINQSSLNSSKKNEAVLSNNNNKEINEIDKNERNDVLKTEKTTVIEENNDSR